MDFCTDYNFLNGLIIIKFIYNAALIIFPIVMLITGTVDGFKAVMSGKADELKGILFNMGAKAASILIILLMPKIIHIVFDTMDSYDGVYNKLTICLNNANKDVVAGLKRAKAKELKGYEATSQTYLASYNKDKYVRKTTSNGATQVSGKGNFVKYNLSDSELTSLAALCLQEQGSVEGAAAEASLMANLFELQGGGYGSGAEGLYNYVKNGGWFANASHFMSNTQNVTSDVKEAVKMVLVDGKRTLPAYVNEHDCLSDLSSVTNNGQSINSSDKSQYKQHTTILKNVYGSTYTFYSFPTSTSDPFGYTSSENRERLGDDCYSFSQLSS